MIELIFIYLIILKHNNNDQISILINESTFRRYVEKLFNKNNRWFGRREHSIWWEWVDRTDENK